MLALAVLLLGPSGAVFLLARQSYLTAAAPVALRARAMSTLGGVTRIGLFVGPVVLAVSYRLLGSWVADLESTAPAGSEPPPGKPAA